MRPAEAAAIRDHVHARLAADPPPPLSPEQARLLRRLLTPALRAGRKAA